MSINPDTIRKLLNDPDIQHVTQGLIVAEVLTADSDDTTLVLREFGDPSPWTALGMAEAQCSAARDALTQGWGPDE